MESPKQIKLDHDLFDAVERGNVEDVVRSLGVGANVNALNFFGASPLQYAAINGFSEIGRLLIAAGADVNSAPANSGWTPLHNAACNGHTGFVQLLADSSANLRAQSNEGQTPHDVATVEVKSILEKAQVNRASELTHRRRTSDWRQDR